MQKEILQQDLMEVMACCGQSVYYKEGQIIALQQDQTDCFYVIKKGRVRVFLMNKAGKDFTIDMLEEGRVFGESSLVVSKQTRLTCLQAICDVELIAFTLDDFIPLFNSHPDLIKNIFMMSSKTIKNLAHQVRRLTLLDASEKVADFLLEITDHPHPSLTIKQDCLPYSHEEIGEFTGLQRQTVTKILNQFQNEKWVRLSYKKVEIIDRLALEAFAYKNL